MFLEAITMGIDHAVLLRTLLINKADWTKFLIRRVEEIRKYSASLRSRP
jgi:hypothetical protein